MRRLFLICIALLIIATGSYGCDAADDSELEKANASYHIDEELDNQKIVFIMTRLNYGERCGEGYFIDGKGKKYSFSLDDKQIYKEIEEIYKDLLDQYEEFESTDFMDKEKLKKTAEALYCINPTAEVKEEGKAIIDYAAETLYGVKKIDGKEEIVFLKSYSGDSKELDDKYAKMVCKEIGDKWTEVK